MCLLWCYNKIRKDGCFACCGELCPSCACLGGIVVVLTAPLGCLLGFVGGLLLGLAKWLPGSVHRARELCGGYCAVIERGAQHYDVEDGRAAPQENRGTIARQAAACGEKCGAEVYCCCLPAFLVWQLLYPVLTLVVIVLITPVNGACSGCNAGCGRLADFGDRLRAAFRDIDAHTSQAAYGGGGHNWCAPLPPLPAPVVQQQWQQPAPVMPVAYASQPVAYAQPSYAQPPKPPPQYYPSATGPPRL